MAWRTAADMVCSRLWIEPSYVEEVVDRESGLVLVAAGLACCIVPEQAAQSEVRPGVGYVPINSDVRVRVAAVWKRRSDEHLLRRSFVELLRSPESELGPEPSLAASR